MPRFTCIKPTTFKGRQVNVGAGVQVSAEGAKALENHPCWKADAVAKKAPAKPQKTPVPPPGPSAEELEVARQSLMETAKSLGLKPRANTGAPKLEEMIREAKKANPDSTEPGSII